jgi:hypothetical protein
MVKKQVLEGVRIRALDESAIPMAQAYEIATTAVAEISEGDRFSEAYRQKQVDKLRGETEAAVARIKEERRRAGLRPLDDRATHLRASMLASASDAQAPAREARASRFGTMMSHAIVPADVDAVWREVQLTNDDPAIRAAGMAGRKRLRDLAEASASAAPAQRESMQAKMLGFDAEVERWTRAHPTVAEQLDRIESQRAVIEAQVETTAHFVARLYGFGAKSQTEAFAQSLKSRKRKGVK